MQPIHDDLCHDIVSAHAEMLIGLDIEITSALGRRLSEGIERVEI